MSDERKQRQLQQLGKRESAFLRLRRTKLGLDDFRTVKVIGKGAFGEVCLIDFGTKLELIRGDVRVGARRPENRYRKDLRYENVEEGGDVKEGPGELRACVLSSTHH